MNLVQIKEQFDLRHDFEDDDLNLLYIRHPNIKFCNIPLAWVFPVDEMLCRFRYSCAVTEVRQDYGQLVVIFKNRPQDQGRYNKYKIIVAECETKIKSQDIDLHER